MKYLMILTIIFNLSYATENYFEEAGEYYKIDPKILWSIAKVESNFKPTAINKNSNGTLDIGLMQINTVHLKDLKKYGFKKEHLFNPKVNIFAGAWILKRCFDKHGVSENGLTCYNGRIKDNPYGYKVLKELKKVYEG
jgi:soluble lytic murein transglycosylase-like protein